MSGPKTERERRGGVGRGRKQAHLLAALAEVEGDRGAVVGSGLGGDLLDVPAPENYRAGQGTGEVGGGGGSAISAADSIC